MSRKHEDATTSEMRHDWLADRWVIIAPQRSERPQDFLRSPPTLVDASVCPFCVGREHMTPDEVAVYRGKRVRLDAAVGKSRRPNWHVRVVPNKFPAVRSVSDISLEAFTSNTGAILATSTSDGSSVSLSETLELAPPTLAADDTVIDLPGPSGVDLFRRRDLVGAHEVIVESPHHLQSISQLDRDNTRLVFLAYRDRLAYWLEERALQYAVVFKNVGQDAGASLSHTHSQLIATDILPTDVERMAKRMALFAEQEGDCIFCRMASDELAQGSRIVEQTSDYIAFCPFASRLPSLVTIIPKTHQSAFESLDVEHLDQLSWLTHRLVRRIEKCYPDAAYNFVIHTVPRPLNGLGKDLAQAYHWRIELFPRLTTVAGFEWGSDCYINPIAPEVAAHSLRSAGV